MEQLSRLIPALETDKRRVSTQKQWYEIYQVSVCAHSLLSIFVQIKGTKETKYTFNDTIASQIWKVHRQKDLQKFWRKKKHN